MRKIIFLLSINFLISFKVQAQIDTLNVENTLKEVVKAFEKKSFTDFEQLLLSKDDYLELLKESGKIPDFDMNELTFNLLK